jgi:hypothetical protein
MTGGRCSALEQVYCLISAIALAASLGADFELPRLFVHHHAAEGSNKFEQFVWVSGNILIRTPGISFIGHAVGCIDKHTTQCPNL